jgi:hypothetical protein
MEASGVGEPLGGDPEGALGAIAYQPGRKVGGFYGECRG